MSDAMRILSKAGHLACLLLLPLGAPATAQTSDLVSDDALRVCADPANAPMSDDKEGGYENRIAELIAAELDRPIRYTWYPMATGFIRNTLGANLCDVVIGYAQGHEMVLNTNHYMTSAYTIIVRADGPLAHVTALSDPALKDARIGIVAGSPPATHMARNALLTNARPYNLMVDRRYESPAENMLDDLAAGEIDAAILWGPLGGPLVQQGYPGFQVTPLLSEELPPRMFFRITMGVRQSEKVWQRQLNSLIRRNQDRIDAILRDAGVPLVDDMGTGLKPADP